MSVRKFTLTRVLPSLVWAMFIVKGLTYVAITPLWEGFDELFHFAYIQSLAARHSLPVWGETFIDPDIAESTAYVPLAGLMPQLVPGFEKLSYRDYWQIDEEKRERFKEKLYRLTASADRVATSSVPLYQVQHPPLYYALCTLVYKIIDDRSIIDKVFALRFFSVLLASTCVVAASLIAKERTSAFGPIFVGLVALWPCLYTDIARVGNDSLGIALFSFDFLGTVRYGERPSPLRAIVVGIFLGLGLLTKAYFLTAIPAVLLFATVLAIRNRGERKELLGGAGVILLCAVILGGWWYLRNYYLYGSFSGLQETMYFPSVGFSERLRAVIKVPWVLVFKHLFVTFCWVNGWSFLQLPKLAYLVFLFLFVISIAGIVRVTMPGFARATGLSGETDAFVAAICLVFFFALGVAYHKVNAYATVHYMGGPGGWYFYAVVVPISFIVSLGIRGAGPKLALPGFILIFIAMLILETYAFLSVLAPYYAGTAVSASNGWGISFIENPIPLFSKETLTRILTNKPDMLVPWVLAILAIAYYAVQIGVLLSIAANNMKSSSIPDADPQANGPAP